MATQRSKAVEPDPALLAELTVRPIRPCRMGELLGAMSPAQAEAILQAYSQGVGCSTVAGIMAKRGLGEVNPTTARTHLKGECRCPKP